MRHLKIVGAALLALFALGAFAASMASAATEEGLLPNATSTGSGATTTLETLAKEKISCGTVSIKEAKFLTEKEKDQHGTAKLEFTKCLAEGLAPANTLGDASGVILSNVLFLVCLVKSATLVFGLLIQPTATEHIEVPAVKELVLVKGAVIAELESTGLTGKEFSYNLEGKAGDQTKALECEINGIKFKHTFESANDKKTADEHASENGLFTLKFPETVSLEDSK
jgi:hypothetical protein